MKRTLWLVIGFVIGAILCGSGALVWGISMAHANEPGVIVRNSTAETIPKLSVCTSGNLYPLERLRNGEAQYVPLKKGEQQFWISIPLKDGTERKSNKVQISNEGVLFVNISDKTITTDYAP
ncbi:MAG: hypothetical protein ABI443_05475 [Chthoniobacterales bacterium]